MARRATGVSKRINRVQLKGLELWHGWRAAGTVSTMYETVSPKKAAVLGLEIEKPMPAIELAIKIADGMVK
jgi:hypothetical protein